MFCRPIGKFKFNPCRDTFSKRKRSEIMRAVKSKNSRMELSVQKRWSEKGIRHRKHSRNLPGIPDISFANKKLVVFLDSCFWHGCRWHGTNPSSNRKFWVQKIKKNKERDKAVNAQYKKAGWKILRFWEHKLKRNQNIIVAAIITALEKSSPSTSISIYEKVKTTKK